MDDALKALRGVGRKHRDNLERLCQLVLECPHSTPEMRQRAAMGLGVEVDREVA